MTHDLLGSVNVEYSYKEGYHIFTSPDLRGFFVANQDAEKAGSEIPEAIELLLRLNEGIECHVEAPASFDDFIRAVKSIKETGQEVAPMPAGLGSRAYYLRCR